LPHYLKTNITALRRNFDEDLITEVLMQEVQHKFITKKFDECNSLIKTYLNFQNFEDKNIQNKLWNLSRACAMAISAKDSAMLEDEIEEVGVEGEGAVRCETEDVMIDREEVTISEKELEDRMAEFEKLSIEEQIEKADSHLLAYTINQRQRDFHLASKYYEELNTRMAVDVKLDNNTNCD
jgi:hypothetical protein